MSAVPDATSWLEPIAPVVALVALVVALVALVAAIATALRVRRVAQPDGSGIAQADPIVRRVLEETIRGLEGARAELERVGTRTAALERRADSAVSRIAIVRFNPFEDTGSNQSFALALLDDRADGVVISSLHSRQSSRIYAKPIQGGRSEAALSAEESEALHLATAKSPSARDPRGDPPPRGGADRVTR